MKKVSILATLICAAMLAGCAPGAESSTATPTGTVPATATATAAAAATNTTAAAETQSAQAVYQTITPDEAKGMIGTDGVVLLDVRTADEFNEAHIGGAVLVPYDEIDQHIGSLPEDKDTTIIVYCRSGRRSAIAAETLIGMGYTSVFDLGGIQDWPYETVTG